MNYVFENFELFILDSGQFGPCNCAVLQAFRRVRNRPFPSSLLPLFQNESKSENEFCMQFHFHANQSHFHKNGYIDLSRRGNGIRDSRNLLCFWPTTQHVMSVGIWLKVAYYSFSKT